jgi:hypothetical protein
MAAKLARAMGSPGVRPATTTIIHAAIGHVPATAFTNILIELIELCDWTSNFRARNLSGVIYDD